MPMIKVNKMINFYTIIFIISCSTSPKWLTYTDNINKVSINYPETWTKTIKGQAVLFASPKEGAKDEFQENMNLILQDLSQRPMNLDQYTELTKKQVVDHLGIAAISSLKNITIAEQ
jgi:hypothetical protein